MSDSLREQLQEAIDQDKGEVETKEEVKAEGKEEEEIKEEPKEEVKAETTKEETPKEEVKEEVKEEEKLAAPEHWDAKSKETFNKQPREVQEWALERHKEMEAGFTKKTTDAAEIKRQYEPIDQIMAPFRPWAQSQGLSDAQLLNQWANAHRALLSGQGREMLLNTAAQYGIDLTGEAPEVAPEIAQLNTVVQNLQGQLQQTQQTFIGQQQQTIEQQLDSFAKQTNEKGELLHPHFDAVIDSMTQLAAVDRQNGRQPEIQSLYEQAVWMNPEIREQQLAAQREAAAQDVQRENAAKVKEEQERAKKANLASANVSGDGSAAASTQDGSDIRSLLEDQFQSQSGRV